MLFFNKLKLMLYYINGLLIEYFKVNIIELVYFWGKNVLNIIFFYGWWFFFYDNFFKIYYLCINFIILKKYECMIYRVYMCKWLYLKNLNMIKLVKDKIGWY